MDLTTVSDDDAVVHDGVSTRAYEALQPDHAYDLDGFEFRTLPAPGERLATVATVNDVHFGETRCGVIEGVDLGPIHSVEPDEEPYPEVMNRGAVADIEAVGPDAVVVKGDLTNRGTRAEYDAFLACYEPAFGDRLHHVRGNHDGYHGETFASDAPLLVELPGVKLAVIDTVIPRDTPGRVTAGQLEWLSDVAAESDRPVLVFGHHHVWDPGSGARPDTYFGIHPDDSERLIAVFAAHPALVSYSAGHTHRNRVRRFPETGDVPWAEVACVKDFPGTWAEYRVFEGGILAVHRRISAPEALAWSERTRDMYGGTYFEYTFGSLDERCFPIWPRDPRAFLPLMARRSDGRGALTGTVRRVVVVGVLVASAAGCSAFDDGSPSATSVPNGVALADLEPGTCFMRPESTDVRTVERKGCGKPHDAEVYAAFDLDSDADAAYPGGARMQLLAQQACQDRFADYVGQAYEDSGHYFSAIAPTRASWNDEDDRRVLCSVIVSGAEPLEASVRAPVGD